MYSMLAPADSRTQVQETTSLSYGAYLWQHRWLISGWMALTGIIADVLALLVNPADHWAVSLIPAGVSLTILDTRLAAGYEQGLFAAFAAIHGYHYERNGQPIRTSATIFGYGHNNVFSNVISGICNGRPFSLFKYTYGYNDGTVRYHAAENNSQFLMMAVAFDMPLSSFLLLRMLMAHLAAGVAQTNESQDWEIGDYTQVLTLEGNFGKTFQVRIRPHPQVEVMALLAPDLMEALLSLNAYTVELASDGTLYVYRTLDVDVGEQDLVDIINCVEMLIPKLNRYTVLQERIQGDSGLLGAKDST